MARIAKDTTPRFDGLKNYAIGALQTTATPQEVPDRFAKSPVAPLRLSGADLVHMGLKSCRDFLISDACKFKKGTNVYFFEVKILEGAEEYTLIWSGIPLTKPSSLADNDTGSSLQNPSDNISINNIIPGGATGTEKLLWNSNKEQIAYLQKSLEQERSAFSKERKELLDKITALNEDKITLNLEKNKLSAEAKTWEMQYNEAQKYMDRLANQPPYEAPQPQGLGDKINSFLGEDGVATLVQGGIALVQPLLVSLSNRIMGNPAPVPQQMPPAQPMYQAPPQPVQQQSEVDAEAELQRLLRKE